MAPCPPRVEDYIPRRPRRDPDDDDDFRGINYLRYHLIPSDNVFIYFDYVRHGYGRYSINEEDLFLRYELFPYSLEHIRDVLYFGLRDYFFEFGISVVSCPCLKSPPYNLAASGLSDNTTFLRFGGLYNIQNSYIVSYDLRDELLRYNHDSFIIGTGYATQPSMPYDGLLTMNATVLPPEIANNNSCIVYKDDTEQLQVKKMTDSNQMVCSLMGNFFFSEGKRGRVIKMRFRGRKTPYNILMLIQLVLLDWNHHNAVVLGGVILINRGKVECYIPVENYPMHFKSSDVFTWLKRHVYDCENLIAIGALSNSRFELFEMRDDVQWMRSRYNFHIFSEDGPNGLFENDVTPLQTEYIAYFNIVQTAYL